MILIPHFFLTIADLLFKKGQIQKCFIKKDTAERRERSFQITWLK